jgi:dolichyl-phosphate-mannose-protein mannosyltransferase
VRWWFSLFWSGLNIGLVSSVKWVGLFGVAMVGLHTMRDLWLALPIRRFKFQAKNFAARALLLIALPMSIYIACFYVHFLVLERSGPGDAQMSSLFQAGLKGSDLSKSPLDVAFGSLVTLRNKAAGGGLLHSHIQTYPAGSLQQQVTGYYHKDPNNMFFIQRPHGFFKNSEQDEHLENQDSHFHVGEQTFHANSRISEDEISFLKDGDVVRLVHQMTNRNLHSHRVQAHVTKADFEVSAYGNDTAFADLNDHWRICMIDDVSPVANPERRVRSLSAAFRLQHVSTGCFLTSGKAVYPEWGFRQQEVSCQRELSEGRHLLWNIETHVNDKLPPGEATFYRSSFVQDFVDVNINMWRTNNALVPDAELEPSALTSAAWQWPFLLTGIRMTSFDDNTIKFYMSGNAVIWWLTGAAVLLATASLLAYAICAKRGLALPPTANYNRFLSQIGISLTGWYLHYLPFFIMGRVLYLHHYYPALFFAILTFAALLDLTAISDWHHSRHQSRWSRRAFLVALSVSVPITITFTLFMPVCYGMHGPLANYSHLQWLSCWKLAPEH